MPGKSKTEKKRNRSKLTIKARVFRFVFLVLVIYFSYTIVSTQIEIFKEKQALASVNEHIREQELLGDDLKRHQGDTDYIEQIAREKLGYAAPDEQVFVDTGNT